MECRVIDVNQYIKVLNDASIKAYEFTDDMEYIKNKYEKKIKVELEKFYEYDPHWVKFGNVYNAKHTMRFDRNILDHRTVDKYQIEVEFERGYGNGNVDLKFQVESYIPPEFNTIQKKKLPLKIIFEFNTISKLQGYFDESEYKIIDLLFNGFTQDDIRWNRVSIRIKILSIAIHSLQLYKTFDTYHAYQILNKVILFKGYSFWEFDKESFEKLLDIDQGCIKKIEFRDSQLANLNQQHCKNEDAYLPTHHQYHLDGNNSGN